MKKLYEKNELTFAIVWIVIYCVLQSAANPLNELIGIEYSASAVFCILQTIAGDRLVDFFDDFPVVFRNVIFQVDHDQRAVFHSVSFSFFRTIK